MTRADDRAAISALIHEYCFRLDAGDFDGVADLFADATFSSTMNPAVRRGRDEIRAIYGAVIVYDDGTPRTQHAITNTTIAFDTDDEASTRSYFTVLQAMTDGIRPILAGEYRDRFARFDGGWRFIERVVVPRLTGTMHEHMQR